MPLKSHCTNFLFLVLVSLFSLSSAGRSSSYYFVNITQKDGFDANIITCMLQDSRGYIWFGTRQGLNRYDGYRIEKFTNQYGNPNSLSGNYVLGLAEDKSGRIWIATQANGLNCYDPAKKRFTAMQHSEDDSNSLRSDRLNRIFVDSRNRLWTGYVNDGWAVYDINSGKLRNFRSAASFTDYYGVNAANTPTWFAEDKKGSVWITTNYGLHRQYPNDSITSYFDKNRHNAVQCDNLFTSLLFTDDTTLWLGTWGAGLKKFNTRTKEFTQYLFDKINPLSAIHNIVLRMVPKSGDELWIGSADKGLGIFNMLTGEFEFIPHNAEDLNSPLHGECYGLLKDRTGMLWAGFYSGISCWNPQSACFRYVLIQEAPDEFKAHVTPAAFYKDTASGLLYAGCIEGKGLYIINEKTGRQQVVSIPNQLVKKSSLLGVSVTAILPINKEELLISSGYGICRFNKKNKSMIRLTIKDQEGKPIYGAGDLVKSGGGFWCNSGRNNGFYFIDSTLYHAVHYYKSAASPVPFDANEINVLYNENDTAVWLAKRTEGICILNPAHNSIRKLNGVNNTSLYGTVMVKQDSIHFWLSSYEHGVFYITRRGNDSFGFRQYASNQGLPSDFTNGLCADILDNIWVATQKGPAVLIKGREKFIDYSGSNGFSQDNVFYQGIYRSDDNGIYLGAVTEYIKWFPDSLLSFKPAPVLYLTSLKIFDKEWNDTIDLNDVKTIELRYNKNFISVSFQALDYTAPAQIEYAYKLDGIDNDWVRGGNRRSLSYSNIPPGTYQLHIKAISSLGVACDHEASLQIIVHPPFWKTWWFVTSCVAAVIALVIVIFKYKVAQLRREEKIKSDFSKKIAEVEMKALRAQMNPHFLFNCLNSINRYIVINETVKASNYLTKFSKLIRLILDNSANDTTTLENEISLLRLYIEMESMRFEGKFTWSIEIDDTLATDTIVIPSMIIQPYVENAIWHGLLNRGTDGHLQIRFINKALNGLTVVIEDNGVGRKKAQELKSKSTLKNKSYGMQITNDRIKVLNQLYDAASQVKIEDLEGANGATGTRVTLHIPYHKSKTDTDTN